MPTSFAQLYFSFELFGTDIDALKPYAKYEIDTCPDEAVTFDPCLKKSE